MSEFSWEKVIGGIINSTVQLGAVFENRPATNALVAKTSSIPNKPTTREPGQHQIG